MVSSMGDMWLDEKVAKELAKAMKDNTKFVTLKGNIIAVSSIRGLLTPEAYKLMVSTRKQNWVCRYGNAHAPSDVCQCQPKLLEETDAPRLEAKTELTPEEKRRGNAMRAWILHNKHNIRNLNNEVEREAFIKEHIEKQLKNNEKTLDKQ